MGNLASREQDWFSQVSSHDFDCLASKRSEGYKHMSTRGTNEGSSSTDINRQQMAILSQLLRAVLTMRQIDEVLQWLAYSIVQRFDIQLLQFWTSQANPGDQQSIQLRTMVRQDATLPEQIVVNNDLLLAAQRIIQEQHTYTPQPVDALFSPYRATLLKRYGLNHCTGRFFGTNVLLPPPGGPTSGVETSQPCMMAILLLSQQPPHRDLMPSIGTMVNQSIVIAKNRGMLQSAPAPTDPLITPRILSQQDLPQVALLVPRRRQDTDFMLLSNPLSGSNAITDKQARRLYAAIDGRSDIAALCKNAGMNIKEAYTALRVLLKQQRIELYEPDGRPVNASRLFDHL
jgi:hypothetical protein